MKTLEELIKILKPIQIYNSRNSIINSIEYDSRKCSQGSIFVAISGEQSDGHNFIEAAIKRNASIIVGEKPIEEIFSHNDTSYLQVINSREALAVLSHYFYDYPSSNLNIYAVTGTNGKTTVTFLLSEIFRSAGYKTSIIGTTGIFIADDKFPATHTTPESKELCEILTKMSSSNVNQVFMEVSSHSLTQNRVRGIDFKVALFTNLTQDHLDYHKNFDEYLRAKKILFDNLSSDSIAVINGDSIYSESIIRNCNAKRIYKVGRNDNNDFIIANEELYINSANFDLIDTNSIFAQDTLKFSISLTGRFNIENASYCAVTALSSGIDIDVIQRSLTDAKGAPGRMQRVTLRNGAIAFIDYAHTPDALEKALLTCKEIIKSESQSKLISVFGCGGDRDKGKRPIMGDISSRIADYTVITSDNPRTEEPDKIIEDIYLGITKERRNSAVCISNRNEAIAYAVNYAKSGDLILLAGKGHENYQIIGKTKLYFDDSEELSKYS